MTEREALKLARQLLWRYRHETPIGNQPHMICQEVDKAFERIDEALAQPEQEPLSKAAFNMAVQGLAGEIVAALVADEKDGGYDLTAGMFGKNFSDLVRRWARAELAQPKEPEQEPVNAIHIGFDWLDSKQLAATYAVPVANNLCAPDLYTAPPQRKPWVGLTDDDKDVSNLAYSGMSSNYIDGYEFGMEAAEYKLKEKNT